MEKVELRTADIAAENAAKLAELFPDIVTEVLDEDGNVRHSIDVEALKAHVGDIAEDKRERYQFTWPGKQRARAEAIRPISKTMRPAPEESVNWDTTENLYIEGDNLDALKILRETYAGKIKMIYIDPPYNTGHDFVYNDDFARSAEEERAESGAFDEEGNLLDKAYRVNNESNGKFHSDWCSMMYPRLVLARDLLSEDGVIFVNLDSGENLNARKICDEVFGIDSFVCDFVWEKKKKPSFLHRNVGKLFDYILVYAKCADRSPAFSVEKTTEGKKYPINNAGNNESILVFPAGSVEFSMPDGLFSPQDMSEGNIKTVLETSFEVVGGRNKSDFSLRGEWRYSQQKLNELISQGNQITISKNPFRPNLVKKGGDIKKMGNILSPSHYDCETNEDGSAQLSELFGSTLFDAPKPVGLIKLLVQSVTYMDSESAVLDFFSGSATTAHAVMQLNAEDGGNRKFIMVQLPEVCDEKSEAAKAGYKNICEIGKERIRRAGAKIAAEVEESNAQLKLGEESKKVPDIGFRVLKIDSTNFEDVSRTPDTLFQDELFGLADNLKSDRTPEDILFELLPKFQIPYTACIDQLDLCGKTVYSVDDDTLLACFGREVPEDVVRAMAEREPAYAVLRDASFVGDDALANFEEIFKTLSPATKTRVV